MQELWDAARSYRRIILRNVQVEAKVGLHPWEMHPERPTRLIVNVEIFVPLEENAAEFVDYDPIREALRRWPQRPHTPLLETLVDELAALCLAQPGAAACRVSVMKPDIFNEAEGAGVEVYRVRQPAAGPATTDRPPGETRPGAPPQGRSGS